jgi:hypothetical protein
MTAESRNSLTNNTAITRRRRGKHFSAAIDTDATTEDAVFSMRSVLRLYKGDQLVKRRIRRLEWAVRNLELHY